MKNNRISKERENKVLEAATQTVVSRALDSDWHKWVDIYAEDLYPTRGDELAKAAAVLDGLVRLTPARIVRHKTATMLIFSKVLKNERIRYLPKNARRLEEKIMAGVAGVPIETIVRIPREGNQNATKDGLFSGMDKGSTKRGRPLSDRNWLTDPITEFLCDK